MNVFVDTSAFLAVLNAADGHHQEARVAWERLIRKGAVLLCSDYVLLETVTLIQNRLGMPAVRLFREDILAVLTVKWIDARLFELAFAALAAAGRRRLSLVDCASFEVMRNLGVRTVFAFDRHFREEGFECLP